jgi:hypothetical protein
VRLQRWPQPGEQVRNAGTHAILRATSDGPGPPGRGQSPATAQRLRSHSGRAAWRARKARRMNSKPGGQHGGRAAAACNQSCARVAGPGARACRPGEGSVSGRAGGRGLTAGAGRARARAGAGRGEPGGRQGSTAGAGRAHPCASAGRGEAHSTAATGRAQHSGRAARPHKQRSTPNLGRQKPGDVWRTPAARAERKLFSRACGRRSQKSPVFNIALQLKRAEAAELWGSSSYG